MFQSSSSFYLYTSEHDDPVHPVELPQEQKLRHGPVLWKHHQELEHHHEVVEIAPDLREDHPEIEFSVEIEIDHFHPIESEIGSVSTLE